VGFAVQLLDEVPMTLLDVRMDAIATEEELIWIR
jgi:5-formyltetrahydrofolate cyclo-ligase